MRILIINVWFVSEMFHSRDSWFVFLFPSMFMPCPNVCPGLCSATFQPRWKQQGHGQPSSVPCRSKTHTHTDAHHYETSIYKAYTPCAELMALILLIVPKSMAHLQSILGVILRAVHDHHSASDAPMPVTVVLSVVSEGRFSSERLSTLVRGRVGLVSEVGASCCWLGSWEEHCTFDITVIHIYSIYSTQIHILEGMIST